MTRVNGRRVPLPGAEPLTPEVTRGVVETPLKTDAPRREFEQENEVDLAFAVSGLARVRVNAFHERGSVSLVIRAIPHEIKTVEELGSPPVIGELADEERGIFLVTGTTGSGKSTTLAAMIDRINASQPKHVVTIEDPIEFLHRDKRSIINQREVGEDTGSFKRALRRVLRQDPDVILVGETRDEETVATALSAAETGHLVLSTLHTLDAPETINRIIDFFPPHMHNQARSMLSGTLKGVISRCLVRTADGRGRVAICEVLRATGRARDMIENPAETGRLTEVISEGEYYGVQTFDRALLKHVQAGKWRWTRRAPQPRTPTTSSCSSPRRASARPRSSRCSAERAPSRRPGADFRSRADVAGRRTGMLACLVRRPVLSTAVVCTFLAAAGCGEGGGPKTDRLTLVQSGPATVTAPSGPRRGDPRSFSMPVAEEGSGDLRGRLDGTVTLVDQRVERGERRDFRLGQVHFALTNGTLTVGGMYVAPPGRVAPVKEGVRRPITGGTGAYRGARGEAFQTPLPGDRVKTALEVERRK